MGGQVDITPIIKSLRGPTSCLRQAKFQLKLKLHVGPECGNTDFKGEILIWYLNIPYLKKDDKLTPHHIIDSNKEIILNLLKRII